MTLLIIVFVTYLDSGYHSDVGMVVIPYKDMKTCLQTIEMADPSIYSPFPKALKSEIQFNCVPQ